jgi:hypothetical protein
MPQMRTTPVLKIRARQPTSDRSSTGFLTSAPWAGRAMRRSHHPGHAQQARPLYVGGFDRPLRAQQDHTAVRGDLCRRAPKGASYNGG